MSTQSFHSTRYALLPLLVLGACNAQADGVSKSCIELKNDAQMEQQYVDDKGQKATRLVPPAKVIPGNEVIYTITAKNNCNKSIDNVVINNPVPEHTVYVANSATGVGTDITYSLNGKDYLKPDALVKEADGKSHAASAADISGIRWIYSSVFQPSATGFVRFRAIVQ